ncbi:MAG: sulfite exporter TauE/SafE family protein [Xanthomonadales bacterium]|nr:sulfite exporter TauE/SafE family protein [Xanthomonadales bacterium]MDH4020110.1 sulfite exporter TauE/SafE family protein [Xanthomonadales bacterium]
MSLLDFFRNQRIAIFGLYVCLAFVYAIFFGQVFAESWVYPDWFIAPIMAFGSFVAGSTFLGGGAVAFPALTKILAIDPVTAKEFSLAIQAVGMSSASLYIVSRVRNLPYNFMALYLGGSGIGLFTSLAFIESHIPAVDLRISFTLFLLCFLAVYLFTRHSHNVSTEAHLEKTYRDVLITLAGGILGGLVSGLLGSGADLIGFCLLALYFRIEIIRATQVSVILMAVSSIMGLGLKTLFFGGLGQQVTDLWIIAAPVVLFGAPLGAALCRRIPPNLLLTFISVIVMSEVISTILLVPFDRNRIFIYGFAVVTSLLVLFFIGYLATHKHD